MSGATPPSPAADSNAANALGPTVEARIARWRQLLNGLALRHQLDGDDVDEVEQDVRIRLWRMAEREGSVEAASASYVYRAVTSAVMDLLRSRRFRTRGRVALDDVADVLPAVSSGPDEAELVATLSRALDTLDAPRRIVVRMHLDGQERSEIAAILGWSEPKVRNLLYRGLDDLRDALRNGEP